MADSYRMHELDDADINRLLPGEILEDIGVVVIDPAERQVPDVVDELAARLASVLGGAPKKTPCHHHPQVTVGRGSLDLAGGKGTVRRVMAVPPPFLPSPPAVPWQVMEGLMRRNSVVIHPTMPTMPGSTPTWPLAGGARPTTTAARRGTGTGVFFPRAEVAAAGQRQPCPCHSSAWTAGGHGDREVAAGNASRGCPYGAEALSWRPRPSASGARAATGMDLLNTKRTMTN
uniref:Uncharacterized protein n=1 Tax=Setaria italica TaxID=4555 RepID=K4ALS9_SETIT